MNAFDDDPKTKLGSVFWTLYLLAEAVLVGGVVMLMILYGSRLSPLLSLLVAVGIFLSATGMGLLPSLLKRRMGGRRMREPQRRYMWRFIPAMLAYVVALFGALWFYDVAEPDGVTLWIAALAPAIPLLFVLRAIMLALNEEDDEYQRARMVYAFTWATAFTIAICTVWGFLETFQIAPRVPLWAVFPLWATGLIPAQVATHLKFSKPLRTADAA